VSRSIFSIVFDGIVLSIVAQLILKISFSGYNGLYGFHTRILLGAKRFASKLNLSLYICFCIWLFCCINVFNDDTPCIAFVNGSISLARLCSSHAILPAHCWVSINVLIPMFIP